MSNKAYLLNEDWEPVKERTKWKAFICSDPTSVNYRMIMRVLTKDEWEKFTYGTVIERLVSVSEYRIITYKNRNTGEEVEIPKLLM